MTGEHEVTVQAIDVGFLKGEINGVTITLTHSDPTGRDPEGHKLSYGVKSSMSEQVTMKRHHAPDEWGRKVRTDVNYYGLAIDRVRSEGLRELQRRNLDDPSDWRDPER